MFVTTASINECTKRGLTRKQRKVCRTYREHMVHIITGSKLALQECKSQLAYRRWNCTFPRHQFIQPPVKSGTETIQVSIFANVLCLHVS